MSNLSDLMYVFGEELARANQRLVELLEEFFPNTANETLSEWEAAFGLDDWSAYTLAERRARLTAKVAAKGGQSIDYFYTIAENLGYNRYPSTTDPHIQIIEGTYYPFRADISQADIDAVYDQDIGTSAFTWRVVGTDVETDTALQEIFNLCKPAHTDIVFENA
jgi:uncharacterized protein YmfQ (DUF2313 family)